MQTRSKRRAKLFDVIRADIWGVGGLAFKFADEVIERAKFIWCARVHF